MVVRADSRRELEKEANTAIALLAQWAVEHDLQLSEEKTQAILYSNLKSKPVIKLKGTSIKIVQEMRYLGIMLDSKGTWIPHVRYVKDKAIRTSNILLSMVGKTWGVKTKQLRQWYKVVTEKILLYACVVWHKDLNVHGRRALQSAQRYFLLQVSRGYRNLSNQALCVVTAIPPINLTAKRLATNGLFIRHKRDALDYKRAEFNGLIYTTVHPATEDIDHVFQNPEVEPVTQIYTDGSKMRNGVGSAYVVIQDDKVRHTWQERLSENNSVFQAELHAITQAVCWLRNNNLSGHIYSDSESAIKALQKTHPVSEPLQAVKSLIRTTRQKVNITWVKAHVGLRGNELADQAAKAIATNQDANIKPLKLPLSFFKRRTYEDMMYNWQDEWTTAATGRDLYPFAPQVKHTRILTDRRLVAFYTAHGPFPATLHRHGQATSPLCACGEEGTPLHYLWDCALTTSYHLRKAGQHSEQKQKEVLFSEGKWDRKIIALTQHLAESQMDYRLDYMHSMPLFQL